MVRTVQDTRNTVQDTRNTVQDTRNTVLSRPQRKKKIRGKIRGAPHTHTHMLCIVHTNTHTHTYTHTHTHTHLRTCRLVVGPMLVDLGKGPKPLSKKEEDLNADPEALRAAIQVVEGSKVEKLSSRKLVGRCAVVV